MSPFRRKRDGDDESSQDPVEAPATPDADEPDPAAWALPADAGAVTTDAGTAATDAAAAESVEAEEPAAVAAADVDPEPEPEPAPIAAAPVDPTPAPEARAAWTPPPSGSADKLSEVSEQRPELLVAGAFAGAFVFARILKRITNG